MSTELIAAVEAADSAEGLVRAVAALSAARTDAAIPTLISVLAFNNPGAAVVAVDGLIQLGSPAAQAILNNLDDYNYGARAWALRALAGIGEPAALPLLLSAAREDFSLSVRRAATYGLGRVRWADLSESDRLAQQQQCYETLKLCLQYDPEWVVRYAAAAALETLAPAATQLQSAIAETLNRQAHSDEERAVQARSRLAERRLAGGV
ncbi:phycocyanin alpha-subunit phycocyanobilin lyase [Synechococcus elongatus PCC 6301]|uniref:Phycocyanin alpha-subunit phycocyanobilin lyase n=1 Tax=Synechococcus sp. (strain ATCC 27144 / PCC 6301 / SAUG 1402/1) TaxID=269084 RepID=A0A0H3K3J9_SYNP6|nr:HEAT repeat domain-containing protein [Synechococcus elongatus]BAD78683.1 phycocyanin alpha-subunit phycocyanobilin lyase [Synechococcus elongatus PCC 6301]